MRLDGIDRIRFARHKSRVLRMARTIVRLNTMILGAQQPHAYPVRFRLGTPGDGAGRGWNLGDCAQFKEQRIRAAFAL